MNERQIHAAVDAERRRGKNWKPKNGSNLLGCIWMRIRSFLQGDLQEAQFPEHLLVGDSMLRQVPFDGMKVFWPGGDMSIIFKLLSMCMLPTVRLIIFHAGTIDIPKSKPWEKQIHNLHDSSIQITDINMKIRHFQEYYLSFNRLFNERRLRDNKVNFYFSDVLYRHCDAPLSKQDFLPCSSSCAQRAGGRLNEGINAFAKSMLFLDTIQHSGFYNPGFFAVRKGKPDLHINTQGALALGTDFKNAIERCRSHLEATQSKKAKKAKVSKSA